MKTICADHPTLAAVARCVSCGRHLCHGCRSKLGVRNYCRPCASLELTGSAPKVAAAAPRARAAAAPAAAAALAIAPAASSRSARLRSPLLSSVLSLLPGLGQLYGGAWLRAAGFFGAFVLLKEERAPAALALFLYVFNLWDAWRVTELRNDRQLGKVRNEKDLKKDRVDDTMFTLAGLGAMAYTFLSMGGLERGDSTELLMKFGALAVALVFAQETRR